MTFAPLLDALALRLTILPSSQLLARLALADLIAAALITSPLAAASLAIRTLTTFSIPVAGPSILLTLAPTIALSRAIAGAGAITPARLSQRQWARADHDEQSQYLRRSTHE